MIKKIKVVLRAIAMGWGSMTWFVGERDSRGASHMVGRLVVGFGEGDDIGRRACRGQ
jgi:hypothetical protein